MRIATLLATALAASVGTAPCPAVADDAGRAPPPPAVDPLAEARRLATEAGERAAAGDMLGAAARFRAAYSFDPRPELQCNVGVAFHKARDLPRAHLYLGQCLTRAGVLDAAIATSVRTAFAALEDELRAGSFAPVDVTVTPDTAVFTVSAFDPEDAMIGARQIWLPFGHHTITARAEGHVEQALDLDVSSPARQPVRLVLERAPVVTAPIAPRTLHPYGRRPALYATGVTGALAIGAVVTYLAARSAASDAGEAGISDDEYDDRVGDARFRQRLSWGLAGGAVVGAALSGWLWQRSTRTTTLTVDVAADGGAGAIHGHF